VKPRLSRIRGSFGRSRIDSLQSAKPFLKLAYKRAVPATAVEGGDVVRIQPDGLIVVMDRAVVFLLVVVRVAAVVEGDSKVLSRFLSRLNDRGATADGEVRIFVLAMRPVFIARLCSRGANNGDQQRYGNHGLPKHLESPLNWADLFSSAFWTRSGCKAVVNTSRTAREFTARFSICGHGPTMDDLRASCRDNSLIDWDFLEPPVGFEPTTC
jgi:hypothetical protein